MFYLTASELTEQLLHRCERLLEHLYIGQNCETAVAGKSLNPPTSSALANNQFQDNYDNDQQQSATHTKYWPTVEEIEQELAQKHNDTTYLDMTVSTNQKQNDFTECQY